MKHRKYLKCLAALRNGTILVGASTSYIKVWNTEKWDFKGSFKSYTSSLAVTKNGY